MRQERQMSRSDHGEGTQETRLSHRRRTTSSGHPGMSAWGFSNPACDMHLTLSASRERGTGASGECQVQENARRKNGEGTQETRLSHRRRTTSSGHPGMSAWGFSNLVSDVHVTLSAGRVGGMWVV